MRRLFNVLILTLALNFLAIAAGVAWLYETGRLDREHIHAIRQVLFPPPVALAEEPADDPADSGQPMLKLEELLAQHAGHPAAEQLEYIRQSFDARMAQLDRERRSLLDLQRLVRAAEEKLAEDRAALEAQKKRLEENEKEAARLAADKGFQDSLALYESMPPRQAKALFTGMDDATVIQYLQAMDGRAAAKITREFKTKEELDRLQRIMETMRESQASVDQ